VKHDQRQPTPLRWPRGLARMRRMKIARSPIRFGAARGSLPHRGFTLVEVLVAIVVLSFGVLGVVGMQVAALQSNKEARNQSVAVALGRELGDMMRSNKDIALLTTNSTVNPYLIDFNGTVPTTTTNCFTGACATTLAVAQFNVRDWLTRVKAALPGARVVVCFDDEPYDTADGRPQWDCNGGTDSPAVVKIGWTQKSINSSATEVERADGVGSGAARPIVILPLIPGSGT